MSPTQTAVVLAAGAGTRMQKAAGAPALDPDQSLAAASGAKAMMPLGGRPFLDYALHNLAQAGMREVVLVIAPHHGDVRRYYEALPMQRLNITFAEQREPRGTAHALLAAREALADREFLLVNGDNHYPVPALQRLAALAGSGLIAFGAEGLLSDDIPTDQRAARLRAFSDLRMEKDRLVEVTEKPEHMPTWVSMNAWRLRPSIFRSCETIEPSARGELELPSAVAHAMHHHGETFTCVRARGPVLDLSGRADVAGVARALEHTQVQL